MQHNVHEKRFEYLKMPRIFSKTKKIRNILFKGKPQEESVFSNKKTCLEYNPNYNLLLPNTSINVPDFKRNLSRLPNYKASYTLNESTYEVDKYYNNSSIFKKLII